jgi:hypothetical protein
MVSLADNTVVRGVAVPPFVEPEALPHLGAGTAFHCSVPAADLERIHDAHQAGGAAEDAVRKPVNATGSSGTPSLPQQTGRPVAALRRC